VRHANALVEVFQLSPYIENWKVYVRVPNPTNLIITRLKVSQVRVSLSEQPASSARVSDALPLEARVASQ
jgi:hypothetical protein